ncbi:MAG: dephospho-CoA kinase [Treponema sp.]|jgi:dephospho-CoA kinase|nr:dephospho-CoA kinase [Treponema sp.]
MIIGLTGHYCAGKNHVGLMLEKRGLPVLDVDKLGHEAIFLEQEAIIHCFGKEVLGSDGFVNRRLLGKQVFGRPDKLSALEAIIHPTANRLTEEWLAGRKVSVINAALLHKSTVFDRLNTIILVWAPLLVRLYRAVKRDKLSLKELLNRVFSQKDFPDRTQFFSHYADIYIVQNSGFPGSQRTLEKRIDAIVEGLRHGKEKTINDSGFCRSISGDRDERRNTGL